jgi:hypothetical protein
MLNIRPGTAMVDLVLEVGPYSLTYYKLEGNPAGAKYSLRYKPSDGTEVQYLWKDGEFRVYNATSLDPLGGWFDSMEDVLTTLEAAFPGVGEVVG